MTKIKLAAFADEAGEDFSVQLQALRRNGMDYLEIRSVEGVNVSKLSLQKARELKARLDDADLACWSIGSPIGKVQIDEAEKQLENFRHVAEIAHILQAERIRMFSFFMAPGEENAAFEKRVLEELARLQEIAQAEKLLLCHENEKGIFGYNAENCLKIHQAVPGIRAVFDPANFVQCGVDTLSAWETLHPYVEYFHAKDALDDGKVAPCGQGLGHVPEILHKYRLQGGQTVTLEPHLFSFKALKTLEKDAESVIKNDYATADEAFDAAAAALKRILDM